MGVALVAASAVGGGAATGALPAADVLGEPGVTATEPLTGVPLPGAPAPGATTLPPAGGGTPATPGPKGTAGGSVPTCGCCGCASGLVATFAWRGLGGVIVENATNCFLFCGR